MKDNEHDIDKHELIEALFKLPEPDCCTVILKDVLGYPLEAVAHEMGISEAEANAYVVQGRMALKAALFPQTSIVRQL